MVIGYWVVVLRWSTSWLFTWSFKLNIYGVLPSHHQLIHFKTLVFFSYYHNRSVTSILLLLSHEHNHSHRFINSCLSYVINNITTTKFSYSFPIPCIWYRVWNGVPWMGSLNLTCTFLQPFRTHFERIYSRVCHQEHLLACSFVTTPLLWSLNSSPPCFLHQTITHFHVRTYLAFCQGA